ncbi:MAG: hypothetical protein U9N73_07665, partial [Candidatus Auribacterota bacterium]|nr:hypothetical protein [Candidatus Auribacterota bacterium]
MNRFLSGSICLVLSLICLLLLSCGEKKPEDIQPYLRLMPADTFLYLGFKDWKVLRDETGAFDFIKTARRLKIGPRIREMLEAGSDIPPGIERTADRLEGLRDRISLWELLGGELALGGYFVGKEEPPVLVFCCRLPEGKEEIYTGYFEELISLFGIPAEQMDEDETDFLGEKLISFSLPDILPGRLVRCTAGDTFIFSTRIEGVRLLLSRLKGEDAEKALVDTPAFREYFSGLDPSAKGVVFLDNTALINYAEEHLETTLQKGGSLWSSGTDSDIEAAYYIRGFLRVIGTVSAIAGNSYLTDEGYRETVRLYLEEKEGSQALLNLLQLPSGDWDILDYIPAGVADLCVNYISPGKIYRPILNFISEDPVRGKELAAIWEKTQKGIGFNLEDDILSWMGDEFAACTLSLSRSFFEPGSFAFLFKISSKEKLDAFLEKLLSLGMEASMNIVIEKYGGSTMRILYPPVPLIPLSPTIGRVGEYLVLASR